MKQIPIGKGHHVEIHSNLNTIAPIWDAILPNESLLKTKHLLPYQDSNLEGLSTFYLLIFEDKSILACVYLQTFDFSNKHYDHSLYEKNIVLKFLKPQLLPIAGKLLICGNLFRIQSSFYSLSNKVTILDLPNILDVFIKTSNDSFESVFIKDLDQPLLKTKHACSLKFRPLDDDLIMQMPINEHWDSLQSYADDLSKKYRKRFEKLQKSKSKIIEKWLSTSEIDENKNTIYSLYQAVASKQPVKIGQINAEYFNQMKIQYGNSFRVLAYYDDTRMVGFASFIFYENQTYEIHYVGFEESDNKAFDIYLNILFDGIKLGIENKQALMELGRTARLAKASLGAVSKKMNSYFSIKWGKAAILLGVVQYYFGEKMGDEWQKRNPFKS